MTDPLDLSRALRATGSFADAAAALLEHGRQELGTVIPGASIARGLIHLRSETRGYTAIHAVDWTGKAPVSYTHLDVYKRQWPVCLGRAIEGADRAKRHTAALRRAWGAA